MNKIITFNTGRGYSDKGQRIAATKLDDGRIMFADVDRGLDGITKHVSKVDSAVERFVMNEYDHGRYDYGTEVGNVEQEALMQKLIDTARAL